MKIVIVGGVAGGASAATRLRRLNEQAEIIMIERGAHISYANCGLPYYIGGAIREQERLTVQSPEGLAARFNIDVRVNNEVTAIDPAAKEVVVKDLISGEQYSEAYDKLILSPGAEPLRPPISGIDSPGIYTLRTIPDTLAIKQFIEERDARKTIVVGGGFIGLEMAENLRERGLEVVVVEAADQVMAPLDPEMAAMVHDLLRDKGIDLRLADGVREFSAGEDGLNVTLQSGVSLSADLVLLAIGVRPDSKLAKNAGLELGDGGAIKVNAHLQTSSPDIYAVGDAIEVTDFVSGNPTRIPLAGPANKQGRIAANHICGIADTYKATQGTAIVKLFAMTIAATGNNEKQLQREGIAYEKSYTHSGSHAGYYPGATPLSAKLLFAPDDGKILGSQIVGYQGTDKRIDVLATALRAGLTVYDLEELELAYAPPFSSAKDPVNMAGYVAANMLNGHHPVIHWHELDDLDQEQVLLLDVRSREEHQLGALPNSVLVPLDQLRSHLHELPRDREIIVYCQIGQRGYLAARMLAQAGFKVRNLSGGYVTYRYGISE
ncbi:MAG: CoA-disulfide reductase [Firmicutes bacterium]|nr:CoA-disulfide reductase [Bacillota bacterium]